VLARVKDWLSPAQKDGVRAVGAELIEMAKNINRPLRKL
jgi:hypothetical protein